MRDRIAGLMGQARRDLGELVAMRSVADERLFPAAECRKAAEWTAAAFTEAGVPSELHETPDGTYAVIGHRPGPAGSPTVLLYSHYDVQPPGEGWTSPPWELTERDGRWYGRGAADCKGNIIMHLTALRALLSPATGDPGSIEPKPGQPGVGGEAGAGEPENREAAAGLPGTRGAGAGEPGDRAVWNPAGSAGGVGGLGSGELGVGIKVVVEGSEEQGTGGLEAFLREHPEMLRADAIVIGDTGNFAVGVPTFTTSLRGRANVVVSVATLKSAMHSGTVGGAAPDALAALVHMLGTLRDAAGNTTIRGLKCDQRWDGVQYPVEQFRRDAGVLDGVSVVGTGTISDMLWARPALTILGIDCPPVVGSAAAVQPTARARLNLRVPAGIDPQEACDALVAHLRAVAPWHVQVDITPEGTGAPFSTRTSGPAYTAMTAALTEAYGKKVSTQGEGGSIPLCSALQETFPKAEIILIGVEDPAALIHAPDESVDPSEIENLALAEALFLASYG